MSSALLPGRDEFLQGLAYFEQHYGYDTRAAHAILDADPAAFALFQKLSEIGRYREDIPVDAWYAANITAVRHEDCGPCVQLCVKMAEEEGVSGDILRAVLAGDKEAMPEQVRLTYQFTEAVLQHSPDADTYREEILKRWGSRALVSLAFGIMTGRSFPTIKYAMGYGQSCVRVTVQGQAAKLKERS